jgi:hypothetical protein
MSVILQAPSLTGEIAVSQYVLTATRTVNDLIIE